jgi:hypothetical protein
VPPPPRRTTVMPTILHRLTIISATPGSAVRRLTPVDMPPISETPEPGQDSNHADDEMAYFFQRMKRCVPASVLVRTRPQQGSH